MTRVAVLSTLTVLWLWAAMTGHVIQATGLAVILTACVVFDRTLLTDRQEGTPLPKHVRDRARMIRSGNDFIRRHLSAEHPSVVEAHFEAHPEDLLTQCPHLPAHRELVTAATGPYESTEVVARLCRLCGHMDYVDG